ncbi:conserved hypothetical protein [delta proteobacterium NaphS2]|nr:conserved hypothetical protein [delta proteobacterium NaphS2]
MHYAAQPIPIRSYHSTTQFMQPLPRRMITAKAHESFQAKSIGSIFLVCYMPHRSKPHRQRFPSSVQNCSRGHRTLCSTLNAMEQTPAGFPHFPGLATGTNKTIWPSQLFEVLETCLITAKPFLKFYQCSWVIFLHAKGHYMLCSLESSAYPRCTISCSYFSVVKCNHYVKLIILPFLYFQWCGCNGLGMLTKFTSHRFGCRILNFKKVF